LMPFHLEIMRRMTLLLILISSTIVTGWGTSTPCEGPQIDQDIADLAATQMTTVAQACLEPLLQATPSSTL